MGAARQRSARRLLLCGLVATLAATTVVSAAPARASGGAQDPPGWVDPGNGAWVAFTVSPTTAQPIGRTGEYEPVEIIRAPGSNLPLDFASLTAAFPTWPTRDTNNDTIPDQIGWPDTWSGGGVTLQRVGDWCDASAPSCAYTVIDPGPFWFAGGVPALQPDGVTPDFSAFAAFEQVLSKPPPQQIVATLTYSKGGPGELGKLVLDGSGSNDPLGGTLTFRWTITRQSDAKVWTGEGTVLTQGIDDPGVYCIDLEVVSSVDGAAMPAGQQCVTFTDAEVPAKPAPGGGGGGTVGPPSGGGGGGGQIATVVFAKPAPRRAPLALGGGSSAPTVVWLWRPEWYTGPEASQRPARSTGQPQVKGKQEIVVNRGPAADGASAGPWLAGLGAFGLIGVGFLVTRKRRLRLEP
jgi:hypothetical protein